MREPGVSVVARPAPADSPALPGTVLAGKYRVGEVIASGGMGVVTSGFHIALSQRIAIKFLRRWTPEGVARFEREARACAKISNEHIVRVLDVDSLPSGTPFMVMELLDGTDLSGLLKERKRLPIEEAVDYLLQACEALAEAHRNGIIHRDLKPANLFLTQRSDGSPLIKVLDFGISKIRTDEENPGEELTTTNTLIGSPSYMSPEQLRAARDADARSDVWALGALLYKLIAGSNPFIAPSTPDLCIEILTGDVRPIEGAPPELFAVIQRCLEKNCENRYQNVGELAEALRPWAADAAVDRVIRTLGVVPRAPTPITRHAVDADRATTTVDPAVTDTTRSRAPWRVPLLLLGLAGGVVGGAVIVSLRTAQTKHDAVPQPIAANAPPSLPDGATSTPVIVTATVSRDTATASTPAMSVRVTAPTRAPRDTTKTSLAPWPSATETTSPSTTATQDDFARFGGRR